MNHALLLFGAGREKRLYAVPPYTRVNSLDFEDHPFEIQQWEHHCALCGSDDSFLDEVIVNDEGERMYVCSDSHYCSTRVAQQTMQKTSSLSNQDTATSDPIYNSERVAL